ncbi:MAG: AMP-binding protein [Flavobacteriaceae bacterium]|nr:AMP-binding protein [Flavobacteriaceae bacterium]
MNREIKKSILIGLKEGNISMELAKKLLNTSEVNTESNDIAIIGMACTVPDAINKEEFWNNLINGVDSVKNFPESRTKGITEFVSKKIREGKINKENMFLNGAYLDEVDKFDNEIFNIFPGEAEFIDPQQRMFLQTALETMENAGYGWGGLKGSNTGVYVGNSGIKYPSILKKKSGSAIAGNWPAMIASRVSYVFDLVGPSMMVSVGCSSSLLAVHLACKGLLSGDCDMAIAGGITLDLLPLNTELDIWNMLGISGDEINKCKAFSNEANGIAKGEGSGAVLLKPLNKAIEDKDNIHAVIKASAINQDGNSNGITAPSPKAQRDLLLKAWKNGKINPSMIGYIEAHGTGTKLGDPIEFKGITDAFKEHTDETHICPIGSVKTNIGHLADGSAGIIGLIKLVLCAQNKKIPPSLHFNNPNKFINFKDSAAYVNDKLIEWDTDVSPYGGVSSFGLCGTNVHVVISPFDKKENNTEIIKDNDCHPFCISAESKSSLIGLLHKFYNYLQENSDLNLHDVAYTINTGRGQHKYKFAVLSKNIIGLLGNIKDFLENKEPIKSISNVSVKAREVVELYLCGKYIDWDEYYRGNRGRRLSLPSYSFDKKVFWPKQDENLSLYLDNRSEGVELKLDNVSSVTKEIDEDELESIWKEVLGILDFDKDEDFFEAGGDSLLAGQIISALHKKFNKKLSFDDFFNFPTFNKLKDIIIDKEDDLHSDIKVFDNREFYPLTFSQKRLWILQSIKKESIAYNVTGSYIFKGEEFEKRSFKRAVEEVINEHGVFKTSICIIDNQPVQIVNEDRVIEVELKSFEKNEDGKGEAIKEFNLMASKPFNLEKDPLVKLNLYSVSKTEVIFCYSIHHIIFDGWSNYLLLNRIIRRYNQIKSKEIIETNPQTVRYVDYALWQNELFSKSNLLQEQEEYWLSTFEGETNTTEIPGDKIRPSVFTFEGDKIKFIIDENRLFKLKKIFFENDVTLFMGLLTTIYSLIFKYTGNTDQTIGSPISGRSNNDIKDVIGFFVNTLALKTSFDKNDSLIQLLKIVKENVLGAYKNQDYPFDSLVEKLNLVKDSSRSPLFNVNVALQNAKINSETHKWDNDIDVEYLQDNRKSTKWDLSFDFIEFNNCISVTIEYYKDLYSEEMISDIRDNYLKLIDDIIDNQNISLQKICSNCNYVAKGEDFYLQENRFIPLFTKIVNENPDKIALYHGNKTITYEELNKEANKLANFILSIGISKGENVAILLNNGINTFISILGILKAGVTYIPIHEKNEYARNQFIIEKSNVSLIISEKTYIKHLNKFQWFAKVKNVLCIDSFSYFDELDKEGNQLMSNELWDYIAKKSVNDIQGGGWVNSYDGKDFSKEEMKEYADNVTIKLNPFISKNKDVLEIGCASGITMFSLYKKVRSYTALDISGEIIAKNREYVTENNIENIFLHKMAAHEIDLLKGKKYDIIVINSVVHCFNGYNYLSKVLNQVNNLLNEGGVLFLGDIMDADKKSLLEKSLIDYKREFNNSKTKLDWSTELFVAKEYLSEWCQNNKCEVSYSGKISTISNELTRYRYDALIQKTGSLTDKVNPSYFQYDACDLENIEDDFEVTYNSNEIAYILFTSGTTGEPKGVKISNVSLTNYLTWANRYYMNDNPMYMPFFTSVTFDFSLTSMFCPLISGGSVFIYDDDFNKKSSDIFSNPIINAIKLTPSHLLYLQNINIQSDNVSCLIVGGEKLSKKHMIGINSLINTDFILHNEYGPTECTVGCVVYSTPSQDIENTSMFLIGTPISNTEVYVLNEDKNMLPLGSKGELYVAGTSLADGYLKDTKKSSEKFVNNPFSEKYNRMYATGDLVSLLFDGNIAFHNRIDEQIKLRGYRIEPEEVENKIKLYANFNEVHVISRKRKDDSRILCAYYIIDDNDSIEEEGLKEFLKGKLPFYMIPSFYKRILKTPLTSHGKIKTSDLPHPDKLELGEIKKSRNEIERSIAEVVKRILMNEISIDRDFFMSGADSIKAIQMTSALQKKGYVIRVEDIFNYPTIESLGIYLRNSNESIINQDEVAGMLPLTPISLWFKNSFKDKINHYNNSILFETDHQIELDILKKSIGQLWKQHDFLRATYIVEDGNDFFRIKPSSDNYNFQVLDLLNSVNPEKEIENYTSSLQDKFVLNEHLIKFVFFKTKNKNYLFILCHHFIIDAVSWRILFEDLTEVYNNILGNNEVKMLPKTHSYKYWSEFLRTNCNNKEILNEQHYWEKMLDVNYKRIKEINHSGSGLKLLDLKFNEDVTDNMQQAIKRYNLNINEFLITALILALREILDDNRILIATESHGRESLGHDIELSRTIGWFTAIYPLGIEFSDNHDTGENIKFIKESLRSIPNKGIGYGILKYLTDSNLKNTKIYNNEPQILFNYLGDFGSESNNKKEIFTISSLNSGKSRVDYSPFLFEIGAMISNNKLIINLECNLNKIDNGFASHLLNTFQIKIKGLIEHCNQDNTSELTPSDFTIQNMDLGELDNLLS